MKVAIAAGDTVAYRPNNGYMTIGKVRRCGKMMVVIERSGGTVNQMPLSVLVLNATRPIPAASE
jgi:hypothetical protein